MQATLTFLGSGTSMGVPTLGCPCEVCTDARRPGSKNRRTRPSVLISFTDHTGTPRNILIDTGPDFHAQAIRENIRALDAVLYTHGHADHILGMDDLRPLSFGKSTGGRAHDLPLYADAETAGTIERVFEYTFRTIDRYPTSARVKLHRIDTAPGTSIELFGATFIRVPVTHGRQTITGWRFGAAAYLTDMSALPDEAFPLLENLDILIVDALRREPHPNHSNLENSIAIAQKVAARRTFFTHISHDLEHDATNAELPENIRLAHDGLQLTFELTPEAAR